MGAIKQARIKKSTGEWLKVSSVFSFASDLILKARIRRRIKNIAVHIQVFLLPFFLKEEVISFHFLGITQKAQIKKGICITKYCQKCSKTFALICNILECYFKSFSQKDPLSAKSSSEFFEIYIFLISFSCFPVFAVKVNYVYY